MFQTYSILTAQIEQNKAAGVKMNTTILDIRDVDVSDAFFKLVILGFCGKKT